MYDWDEYLKVAESLLEDHDLGVSEETYARIAISRAYYAVFHKALFLCQNRKELKPTYGQGKGSHDEIYNKLSSIDRGSREFKSSCHSIANTFKLLKLDRQKADYRADKGISIKEARLHCSKSKYLINEIKELCGGND